MRNLDFLLGEKFIPLWNYPVELRRGGNYSAIFGEWKLASFQDEIRESTLKTKRN